MSLKYGNIKDGSFDIDNVFSGFTREEDVPVFHKKINDLKIKVTSAHYDNIGAVLDKLNISYKSFDGTCKDCDILFINCDTCYEIHDIQEFRQFIFNGGIAYISDLSASFLTQNFPGIALFDYSNSACTINAKVLDADLISKLGNHIKIIFDMGSWARVTKLYSGEAILVEAKSHYPIMFSCSVGAGKIFYTSFHNHSQLTDHEEKLLQLLIVKQLSQRINLPFNTVFKDLGL
jgi:hypothetical protein